MSEFRELMARVITSMVADGASEEQAGRIMREADRLVTETLRHLFTEVDKADDADWPNLYALSLQMLAIHARMHDTAFRNCARRLGIPEGFVEFSSHG